MQAGYKRDNQAEAKSLKIKARRNKLDNALYGSDVSNVVSGKLAITTITPSSEYVSTSADSGAQTIVSSPPDISAAIQANESVARRLYNERLNAEITPSESASQVIRTQAPAIQRTAIYPQTLAAELLSRVRTGITPSQIRNAVRSTIGHMVDTVSNPATQAVPIVSTTSNPMPATEQAPPNTTSSPSLSSVSSSLAASDELQSATRAPPNTISSLASSDEFQSATQADASTTNELIDINDDIQTAAQKVLDMASKKHPLSSGPRTNLSITVFKANGGDKENRFKVKLTKKRDSIAFKYQPKTEYKKDFKHKNIDNFETDYDWQKSFGDAIRRLVGGQDNGEYNLQKDGAIHGLGLRNSKMIHWAYKANRDDKNFIIYPAFVNGNVRYYSTGTRIPTVSINRATKSALNIVRDIVETQTFSQADYATLDSTEGFAINKLIRFTRPKIPAGVIFDTSHAGDINELRKRYQVLVGELSAGNRGKLLKQEMIDILESLKRMKSISKPKADQLINGIEEL